MKKKCLNGVFRSYRNRNIGERSQIYRIGVAVNDINLSN